jgi:hypothetical protein
LNNIIISRVFTIYQLADIVINVLPKVIEQYDAKMVVVSDLLDMFIRDPQIEVKEARYLINEIVSSIITKSRALEYVLAVVSLPSVASGAYNHHHHHHNNNDKPSKLYNNKMVLPRFSECIEITNSRNNKNKMIDVKIRNNSCSNVRRNKKTLLMTFMNYFFQLRKGIY